MFALPNAGEIILNMVREGAEIPENRQNQIFGLPNAADILLAYVRKGYPLSEETLLKIFNLENRKAT